MRRFVTRALVARLCSGGMRWGDHLASASHCRSDEATFANDTPPAVRDRLVGARVQLIKAEAQRRDDPVIAPRVLSSPVQLEGRNQPSTNRNCPFTRPTSAEC
jgi:hypothetical protein